MNSVNKNKFSYEGTHHEPDEKGNLDKEINWISLEGVYSDMGMIKRNSDIGELGLNKVK